MNAARLAARRPAYRCLNAHPRLRQIHVAGRGGRFGEKPSRARLDDISVHRADAIRYARYKTRRNWLAAGAALSMIAPMILVRFWDLPPPSEPENQQQQDHQQQQQNQTQPSGPSTTQQLVDLIKPRPVQADSPRIAADEFHGKKVVLAAGDKIIAAPKDSEHPTPSDVDTIELVETGTSYVPYFPRTISLPDTTGPEGIASEASYTLLGLGIRKVSFLNIQVYVVGLYVKSADLAKLQNQLINTVNPSASALIPGEKEDLRKALLGPESSTQVWRAIVARQGADAVDMAFRIVPTRGTDFKHLQDAMMRGITNRTDDVRRRQADMLRQQAKESKTVVLPKPVEEGEFEDERFGVAMKEFKALFQGRGKAGKGSVVIMKKDKDGALSGIYQPVVKTNKGEKMGEMVNLGEVKDPRISRLVWEIYLAGPNVSCEEARKSIVDGCISIVERPVGTVENMIQ
ncbi:hypothetical protein BU24DRAFT_416147 [Aaosphaeria arxii CBS 175.79]|uniref:Chalcone isomerase domain-containing protein n=1 Tax=Aaosphaeria arxii CBS 175.79 TaxID=1450172 RepID=A0A6A5Y5A6_9PLEO|nr:uncharacterized protein BU24DRAFT_416147 [Aaosphaeria arxii CBS 175.79]KAF2020459.1 hypothetical protein BU24DRAFT_416147 [Aaosphaeria arxii CBS 175.79]